jgi:hypothetical protein
MNHGFIFGIGASMAVIVGPGDHDHPPGLIGA